MSKDICTHPDCTNEVGSKGAKGLCPKHYRLSRPPCVVADCNKPQSGQGYCGMHYYRYQMTGDPLSTPSGRTVRHTGQTCAVEGCEQPRRKRDWCASHYSQWRNTGEVKPFERKWGTITARICEACGKEFRGRQPYCGTACKQIVYSYRRKGKRRSLSVDCVLCGAPTPTRQRKTNERLGRTDRIYCRSCTSTSAEARRYQRYGVLPEEYEAALLRGCDICGTRTEVLSVDHDHTCCPADSWAACGECNRGFLCGNCNRALGLLRDDPDIISRAREYLLAAS